MIRIFKKSQFILSNLACACVFSCSNSSGTCNRVHHGMPKRCSCSRCVHSCFDAQIVLIRLGGSSC